MLLTEQEAREGGGLLLSKLTGVGWQLRVWSNDTLNWHFSVMNRFITVYQEGKRYHAFLTIEEAHPGGGEVYWSDNRFFDDPNEAVADQMQRARAYLNKMRRAIEYVEKAAFLKKRA
jgi:hypothetical protein